ncbi:MAG: endonuclease [Planctomycetaceae bacterium]|nr:endonuclease [Planctomycetaceae bacterium]
MPAITNKQQLLTQSQTALKKRFPLPEADEAEPRPLLEELIYAICREASTSADADAGYARLRKTFVDWNEVRVSTVQEVGDVLRPLSGSGSRAKRIIGLLQEVFEDKYSFDLSELDKKGLKDTARKLRFYKEGVNDYAVAWVIQRTLGGHAIPLDEPTLRVLRRLGVIEDFDPDNLEAVRGSIEHVIPKTRGSEFTDLMSVLAKELCTEHDPNCPNCPLKSDCSYGIEHASKKSEPKPKKSR